MTYQQEIPLTSRGHGDMHDLTAKVAAAVRSSAIQNGVVHVFNLGSTAAIGAIEFEPGLQGERLPGDSGEVATLTPEGVIAFWKILQAEEKGESRLEQTISD
jgi:hypothetical protein